MKWQKIKDVFKLDEVTPYGGVWIEITPFGSMLKISFCHALWRRVD